MPIHPHMKMVSKSFKKKKKTADNSMDQDEVFL